VYKRVTDTNICINKNEISDGRYVKLSEVRALIQSEPELYTSTFSLIYANYINKID